VALMFKNDAATRSVMPTARVALYTALAAIAVIAALLAVRVLPENLQTRPSWPGHAAYVATGCAFLLSDVLWLRLLATVGNACTITYSYYHPNGQVLWLPLEWSLVYMCINSVYIFRLLRERIVLLSKLEQRVYDEHFADTMSKIDFLPLVRCGTFLEAARRTTLLTEGEESEAIFLVVDGKAEVSTRDRANARAVPTVAASHR
jgi:hypothetical protein